MRFVSHSADDFIVGFQYQSDAERLRVDPAERFRKFRLEQHPDKTRLLEFGPYAAESRSKRRQGRPETFDVLGFTHICGKKRNERYTVLRQIAYAPRRPQTSPLYRVLADHFVLLEREHEQCFEPTHGPLRPAARRSVGRFLDCGLFEHGNARVRCAQCRAEFLVAFRCNGRHFCPSCHARRLAE